MIASNYVKDNYDRKLEIGSFSLNPFGFTVTIDDLALYDTDGETLGEIDTDGDTDGEILGLILADGLTDGETEGDMDADGLTLGLSEGEIEGLHKIYALEDSFPVPCVLGWPGAPYSSLDTFFHNKLAEGYDTDNRDIGADKPENYFYSASHVYPLNNR